MIRRILWTSGALCLCTAVRVFAEEGAHGEGGLGETIPLGTFWNSLATLVTFGVVLIVLGRFAWKPLLKALQNRENFIRESLQSAKTQREQAEQMLAEYKQQLEQARSEATAIVEEGRRDSDVVRRQMQEATKKETEAMLQRARREIQIARDTAVKDLYTLAGDLATDIAGKIISKEIDAQGHEDLIQESIDRIAQSSSTN